MLKLPVVRIDGANGKNGQEESNREADRLLLLYVRLPKQVKLAGLPLFLPSNAQWMKSLITRVTPVRHEETSRQGSACHSEPSTPHPSEAHVKKVVQRERKLPAFSLSIGELEALWSRLTALFDDPADIYASFQIRLPLEQLEFSNPEELRQYPHLPSRVTNFHIRLSDLQKGHRVVAS